MADLKRLHVGHKVRSSLVGRGQVAERQETILHGQPLAGRKKGQEEHTERRKEKSRHGDSRGLRETGEKNGSHEEKRA
jgi:hypothetical protein